MRMIEEVEFAKVKWFNREKLFGFLLIPGKPDLFFHFNNGNCLKAAEQQATGIRFVQWYLGPLLAPRPGDELAFQRGENAKGSMAGKWGYAEDYRQAARTADKPVHYRVMKETKFSNQRFPVITVMWQGADVAQLEKIHPRSDTPLDDCYSEYEFVNQTTKVWFERESVSGEWASCSDPRPKPLHISVLTTH